MPVERQEQIIAAIRVALLDPSTPVSKNEVHKLIMKAHPDFDATDVAIVIGAVLPI